jgi:hypothetical protein
MAQQHFPANREIGLVLLALQAFQVLFLKGSERVFNYFLTNLGMFQNGCDHSGIYLVSHSAHRLPHEVTLLTD